MSRLRLGILTVYDVVPVSLIAAALPPGHAVIAQRAYPCLFVNELLIEGPDMPQHWHSEVDPPAVQLVLRSRGRAFWQHDTAKVWTVDPELFEVLAKLRP